VGNPLKPSVPAFIYNAPLPEMLGSINVQALIPAHQIGAKALYFGAEMEPEPFLDRHQPGVLIITKMIDDGPLRLAEAAEKRGIPVVAVFCDLHVAGEQQTGDAKLAVRNKALGKIATAVVAPTEHVAAFVREHYGLTCSVIEEAVEYPRTAPAFMPSSPVKLLYTGHPSNHDTIADGVKTLVRFTGAPLSLLLVSSQPPNMEKIRRAAPNVQVDFIPWSPINQLQAFHYCDIVFVPSKDEPSKHAKGQLRVLSAIQMGKIAIAYPLRQYLELQDYCYCGTEYAELLARALKNPAEVKERILAGQQCIDRRFSPEVCGDKWQTLIDKLAAAR
jgi:glycosyltransferase involved in cell wall biosynthesis